MVVLPEPDPAGDQDEWRLAVLAQVTDQAADEGDGGGTLNCQRIGQNAGFPAPLDYLRGEDTFGHEYRRSVQPEQPIIRSSTVSNVVNRDL